LETSHIRNFCIIAHIDHGKSTLADRLLQLTGTVADRDMTDQVLDSMDLEREKGVTIKASAVRMSYRAGDGQVYEMNLIDTPGHVDFGYEVSRALEACEGAVLVVDATQGIEAQTLANLYLALNADLEVLPVINKIDLASAQPDQVAADIQHLLGTPSEEILRISAKEGTNVQQVLEAIVRAVPPPGGDANVPLRSLIFDSHYDSYKGVIAYVRVVEGQVALTDEIRMLATGAQTRPLEIGYFAPQMAPVERLSAGEVGYIATGLKTVRECRVGDTIASATDVEAKPLPGYQHPKPMVFAGFYPVEGEDYANLKDALEKLQLNDASLVYEPETSQALNFGFRCGFLGLFHMDIVQERLEREHDLDLIATAPSVEYEVALTDDSVIRIDSPAELPDASRILEVREPWMRIQIFTPDEFFGTVMDLATKREVAVEQEYRRRKGVVLPFDFPSPVLSSISTDRLTRTWTGHDRSPR
jgi:GTP-binding protein LepA